MGFCASPTACWQGTTGAMNPEEAKDYTKPIKAILQQFDINAESYRQWFQFAVKKQDENNRELAARLDDLATVDPRLSLLSVSSLTCLVCT